MSLLENSKLLQNIYGSKQLFNYATPAGGDVIPTATLTKAQKTFSTSAENPNLPKPKSLYFVYFGLNKDLANKIEDKKSIIKLLAGLSNEDIKELEDINEYHKRIINEKEENTSVVSKVLSNASDKLSTLFSGNNKSKYNTRSDQTYGDDIYNESTLVDYIPDIEVFKKLSYEMSKLVKSYDKPAITFTTNEFNEYNRKRIIYDKVQYSDVKISFYDVKDNPVQQFLFSYLKFIDNDFLCKDFRLWEKQIDNTDFNMRDVTGEDNVGVNGSIMKKSATGGVNQFGFGIDSHFKLIDKICFCEYYMDRMMVYTLENPVITGINWGTGEAGNFESNTITVTFKYEGITNDLLDIEPYNVEAWYGYENDDNRYGSGNIPSYLRFMINKEIRSDVATFLQTKYQTQSTNILGDITSILKSYMNGDVKFSWNTLKNQALDTARKYGYANEANTYAQIEQTVDNYNNSDNKTKYLTNISTDPTSLIGKFSRNVVSDSVLF